MRFSTILATSIALASTAQACVRILVNQVWEDSSKKTREIIMWDQDKLSDYRVPYGESHGSYDEWRGEGYTVDINQYNDGGTVSYPSERSKLCPNITLRLDSRSFFFTPVLMQLY